jgi:conserved hypothetical protein
LGIFVGIVVLYILTIWTCARITVSEEKDDLRGEINIYILTNGKHTDIVMPVRSELIDWSIFFPFDDTISKDTTLCFAAIGWGDKGFYMEIEEWSELTARIAFRAAFGISTSALHVTYYGLMTEGDDCIKIPISKSQYQRLINYILESRQTDDDERALYIETDAQYGENDSFYEARRRYSFFYTCNTWANNALKHSGQRGAVWTLDCEGIFRHYRRPKDSQF